MNSTDSDNITVLKTEIFFGFFTKPGTFRILFLSEEARLYLKLLILTRYRRNR
jgi:hypothetical protein